MARIESWKLEEIQRTLEMSLSSFLEITPLDSKEEVHRKSIETQSCITRMIDNCLTLLKDNKEDNEIDEDKLDELAKETWTNRMKLASANHVIVMWDNFIDGFKVGFHKGKEE